MARVYNSDFPIHIVYLPVRFSNIAINRPLMKPTSGTVIEADALGKLKICPLLMETLLMVY
ncbi:MAG: hypothetical protein M1442_04620 [Candidatus Thermoplasmatota archaeon]|nr:hypothetical protein [Candidatus Thermoplasmatota archaeon]